LHHPFAQSLGALILDIARATCYYPTPHFAVQVRQTQTMAKTCHICGKHTRFASTVSHSGKHSKRTWTPNLQSVNAIISGRKMRIEVCTRCLKAGKVTRAS
jgi:large subunit ribosomal protein L28